MSKNGRITIKEIAQQAGVSKQTVSRVLNNRPDVSPQTRNRIQTIIEQSNYQPSKLARSLTRGRTYTIGVLGSDLRHVGPSHTLIGIDEQAYATGYSLSLSLLHEQDDELTLETILNEMLAHQVDGIIWTAVNKLDSYEQVMTKLADLPVPVVVGAELRPQGLSAVHTDSCEGGVIATQHLLDQGYETIAIITGPLNEWSAKQRLVGWQETVTAAEDSLIFEGDWTAATGYAGIQQLLQQRPDIDAVFASNDQMALGVLKAAQELGRCVPQDLGVVGFDDIPEAVYFSPSLTTIRQSLVENGRLLVQELDRQIQAHSNQEPIMPQVLQTPPQLIIRASSVKTSGVA
jgi:DNA-binding LacI/PurR family transcriptional regulator